MLSPAGSGCWGAADQDKRGAAPTPLHLARPPHIAVRSFPTASRRPAPAVCGAPLIEHPYCDISNILKGDGGPHADDQGVGNPPGRGSRKRRRNATAGVSDQL